MSDTTKATSDYWQERFAPAAPHNAGAGEAMYRKCLKCGSHAMEGALSAHARWCDKQEYKALVLNAFDSFAAANRREFIDRRADVRHAAKSAL